MLQLFLASVVELYKIYNKPEIEINLRLRQISSPNLMRSTLYIYKLYIMNLPTYILLLIH